MTASTASARLVLPATFAEAIHVELTGAIPLDVAALLEQARAEAYTAGILAGIRRVAAHQADLALLGDQWRDRESADARHRREADIAQMEAAAARINVTLGKPARYRYRGGPVDFDSGMPVGSACAWLRNRQAAPVVHLPQRRTVHVGREAA